MATRVMYDRVIITVNGQVYNPDGEIRRFRASARASTRQQQSMTPDGSSAGIVFGNSEATLDWVEYFPKASQAVNWMSLLLASPNSTIEIKPYSIGNAEEAEVLVATGVGCTAQDGDAAGEGEAVVRNISLTASKVPGLTY
jgi:hypothetical protein